MSAHDWRPPPGPPGGPAPQLPSYGDAGDDERQVLVNGRRSLTSSTQRLAPDSRLPNYGEDLEEVVVSTRTPSRQARPARRAGRAVPGTQVAELIGVAAGESEGPTTESAMRGLFGRDSIYLLVVAAQAGVAALSIPITTRLLGGTQFAVVTTSLAVMQVLLAIGVFSLPTAVQRNYREQDGGHDAQRTITLAIITAAITLAIAFATGPLWSPALSLGPFGPTLRYAVIWAALTAVTFAGIALLRSRNRLRAYALISFVQSIAAELLSVLLVVFVHHTAQEFILGEMLMQGVAAAIAVYLTRPLPLRRRDLELIVSSLKYSGALVPAAIAGFLLTTSDRLVIHHDLPVIEVARYGAVYNIASIPALLLGLLDPVWLPRFFALKDDALRAALLADSRDALYRLLIPTVLGLGIGIPLVLSFWLQAAYHPGGLPIVIVTISAGAFAVAGYISANRVLLISGRTVPVAFCMVATAAFNIGANILLVPRMGIEGSALATSLAFVVLQGLVTFFAHRVQPLRRPPPELIVGCAIAIAAALSCTLVPSTGVFAAARAVLTLACLIVFAAMLHDVIAPGNDGWVNRAVRVMSRR